MLDLAILACRAQLYFQEEAYRFPRGYDPEHPQVDRIGLQGDAMTVEGEAEQVEGIITKTSMASAMAEQLWG